MRIGYDITAIDHQPSGVGNYALYLLNHLVEAESSHEYLMLSNRRSHPASLPIGVRLPHARDVFPSRMLWMQCVLPSSLRALRPDMCHYPNSIGPLVSPCPYVVTIHDMTLTVLSRFHPWRKRIAVRPLIPLVAWRASRIITVSEHARRDIVRILHVPAERVQVIPEAASPLFRPAEPEARLRVRARYGLCSPYLLYVGTLEPRKNIVRLVRAWHRLRQRGIIPHRLVIVGARGWQDQPIFDVVRELSCADGVTFTGYVPLADLPALYSEADAFAFPSLYEGFGLPVVEAMACGTPVLISAAPALVEVAGNAALQVDARATDSIADGLERILTDSALRDELRVEGLRRASGFSWQSAAHKTLQLYRDVAGHVAQPGTAGVPERI